MSFRVCLLVYFFVLGIEIFAGSTGNLWLQYASKPLLMPCLAVYFLMSQRRYERLSILVLGALAFSWIGDVVLLANRTAPVFFIGGLVAFLIAHVFYIAFFVDVRRHYAARKLPTPLVFIAIAAYSLGLFTVLAPYVVNLLVPVAVYALTISVMFAAAVAAFDLKRHDFGRLCVAGAALFVVSDSILAINRFVFPLSFGHAAVMITYAIAQFLIVEGAVRMFRHERADATE